jgi:hypothetical protein
MHPCIVGLDNTEGTTNLEKKKLNISFSSKTYCTFCPDIHDFEILVEFCELRVRSEVLLQLLLIRMIKFTHVNFLF